jgi:hypothetical protein
MHAKAKIGAALLMLLCASTAFGVQRVVLVELFTNTS